MRGLPNRPEQKADRLTESEKSSRARSNKRSNKMKVKTNTKAGNALWGS